MPFSALIGGILGGPLIEGIGRRTTILSTALPFTICEYIKCTIAKIIFVDVVNQ